MAVGVFTPAIHYCGDMEIENPKEDNVQGCNGCKMILRDRIWRYAQGEELDMRRVRVPGVNCPRCTGTCNRT